MAIRLFGACILLSILSLTACSPSILPAQPPSENTNFQVQALTQPYLKRKLSHWLNTSNDTQLVNELDYARIKHPATVKAITDADVPFRTQLVNNVGVRQRRSQNITFDTFIVSLLPPPTYATWDASTISGPILLANSNRTAYTTSGYGYIYGTIGVSSGKWYWEYLVGSDGGCTMAGMSSPAERYAYYAHEGTLYNHTSARSYGPTYNTGDRIGIALNLDDRTITFYKNGISLGVAGTNIPAGTYRPYAEDSCGGLNINVAANFGQGAFTYPVPAGHNPGIYQQN